MGLGTFSSFECILEVLILHLVFDDIAEVVYKYANITDVLIYQCHFDQSRSAGCIEKIVKGEFEHDKNK